MTKKRSSSSSLQGLFTSCIGGKLSGEFENKIRILEDCNAMEFPEKYFGALDGLSASQIKSFIENVTDPSAFAAALLTYINESRNSGCIEVLKICLSMHSNLKLREKLASFFSLPIFSVLSVQQLQLELTKSGDSRLSLAVENVSKSDDRDIRFHSQWFKSFLEGVLASNDDQYVATACELVLILLLQPSYRRFVRPLMEDVLFCSAIKFRPNQNPIMAELIDIYYYPMDEASGIYYDGFDQFASAQQRHLQFVHSSLLKQQSLFDLHYLSLYELSCPHLLSPVLARLEVSQLIQILHCIGIGGFSKELPSYILIDGIISSLGSRNYNRAKGPSGLPTEKDLQGERLIIPITHESLSVGDLISRHQLLLKNVSFSDLKNYIAEQLSLCKPVLNKAGKLEFTGWSRDALEVLSSAITKKSSVNIEKRATFQVVEFEVVLNLASLDNLSRQGWLNLLPSELVYVCEIFIPENREPDVKVLRTAKLDSKSVSSNNLTLRLHLDPDQYDKDAQSPDMYSSVNLLIKRASSESNDIKILSSVNEMLLNSPKLPLFLEDLWLGIGNGDSDNGQFLVEVRESPFLRASQKSAFDRALAYGLSVCLGDYRSGCSTVLKEAVKAMLATKVINSLVLCRSSAAVDRLYSDLISQEMDEIEIVRLGYSSTFSNIQEKYSKIAKSKIALINEQILGPIGALPIFSCRESEGVFKRVLEPQWNAFIGFLEDSTFSQNDGVKSLLNIYPYSRCLSFPSSQVFDGVEDFKKACFDHFAKIKALFETTARLAPLELLQSKEAITSFVLENLAKVVLMTSTYAAINCNQLSASGLHFDSLLIDDAHLIPEIEIILSVNSQKNVSSLKSLSLFGNDKGHCSSNTSGDLQMVGISCTLLNRFLSADFNDIVRLEPNMDLNSPWNRLRSDSKLLNSPESILKSCIEIVDVRPHLGKGEEHPMRGYLQNLDEAEFAIAIYQILRLKNVKAEDIAIITPYKGQVDLIKEVQESRCSWTEFFSHPSFIGTIDQCSGLSFKYVILSLVRTRSLGFLSDPARLNLAISRADENLIILGHGDLFSDFFGALSISSFGLNLQGLSDAIIDIETVTKFAYDMSMEQLQ